MKVDLGSLYIVTLSDDVIFAERVMNDQVSGILEVDNQVGEVQDIMSNSVSENERVRVEAGAVNEVAATESAGSSILKENESELLAEGSLSSEEKHTIRIEV